MGGGRGALAALLLLLFCVCASYASGAGGGGATTTKFEKLKDEASKAQDGVVKLTSASLRGHASGRHNYSLVVLFSTKGQQIPCPLCPDINDRFDELAAHFAQAMRKRGYESKEFLEHPVFLARCNLEDCHELFVESQWRSIPKMVHLGPRATKGNVDPEIFEDMDNLLEDISMESMAQFVEERTGFPLKIVPSRMAVMTKMGGMLAMLAIAAWALFPQLKQWYVTPNFWFLAAMGVYCFTMSGAVFNAIHKPPMSYTNPQNGAVYWIYPQARMQFIGEGFILAALLSTTAFLAIAFTTYLPTLKDKWRQRATFVAMAIAFYMCYSWLLALFKMKHRWYPY